MATPEEILTSMLAGTAGAAEGVAGAVEGMWNGMDTLDKGSLVAGFLPVVGNAIGVANDIRNYAAGRQPVTPANLAMSAVGAIPLVGQVGKTARQIVRAATAKQKNAYMEAVLETGVEDWANLTPQQITEIEKKTGAFIGPDGEILQYIHTPGVAATGFSPISGGSTAESPGFFLTEAGKKRYGEFPEELKDVLAELGSIDATKLPRNAAGAYFPTENAIAIGHRQSVKSATGTLRHEVTHAAQTFDNLQGGGNSSMFHPMLKIAKDGENLTQRDQYKAYFAYKRLTGELQAHTVAEHAARLEKSGGTGAAPAYTETAEELARQAYKDEFGLFDFELDDDITYQLFAAVNRIKGD